jgi:pSer/pThr/pTyr-binding forkhead associated (FHA) protein
MQCPNCGAVGAAGYRFCAECGTPMASAPPAGSAAGQALVVHVRPDGDRPYGFQDDLLIGRTEGQVRVPDDRFLSSRHATLVRTGGRYVLRDLGSRNGTYVRIREPAELGAGDHVMMGSQVFRLDHQAGGRASYIDEGPAGATRVIGADAGRVAGVQLVRILEGGVEGERIVLPRTGLTVGRTRGDLVYPDDPLLSGMHGAFEAAPGGGSGGNGPHVRVEDRGSRNGVLLRIRSDWPLRFGDVFAVGRQVFRFEAGDGPVLG